MVHAETSRGQSPDASSPLRRFIRWFLGTEMLAEARAAEPAATKISAPHVYRARLAMELADRALDDFEPLKTGPGPAVAVSLLREAAYWALTARRPEESSKSLLAAFDDADGELLIAAAGDESSVEAIRAALVERTFVETAALPPKVQEREARRARAFAAALIASLEQSSPAALRMVARRRARFALAAMTVLGLSFLVLRPSKKADLAAHKSWHTSSAIDCDLTFGFCGGKFVELLFHTSEEDSPWAELDLGSPMSFTSVQIRNREDCCKDRAVPLVVQASDDRNSWKELGRRTSEFEDWELTFPAETARYLRFAVERRTMFHLKSVSVH
jgi:hypothetical protein